MIGFVESANIINTMHERGIGPTSETNVWGVDGNLGIETEMADPSILETMRFTQPSVDLGSIGEFIARLEGEMPPDSSTAWVGRSCARP